VKGKHNLFLVGCVSLYALSGYAGWGFKAMDEDEALFEILWSFILFSTGNFMALKWTEAIIGPRRFLLIAEAWNAFPVLALFIFGLVSFCFAAAVAILNKWSPAFHLGEQLVGTCNLLIVLVSIGCPAWLSRAYYRQRIKIMISKDSPQN
jgi:hypothetical protein